MKTKLDQSTGTVCKFSERSCMDLDRGYAFWNEFPAGDKCVTKQFDIIFKGRAVKTNSTENNVQIYSLNTEQTTFSLMITGQTMHCNRMLLRTEHPKLLMFRANKRVIHVSIHGR